MKYMISMEVKDYEIKNKEQLKKLWDNLRLTKTIISNHINKSGKKVHIVLERYVDCNHDRLVFDLIMDFNESLSLEEKERVEKISINKIGVLDSYMEDWE